MVLELARPADWALLSAVWRAAQSDLGLPAPAIAVNGVDGYQLWFSLRQPLPAADAQAFLKALCARYLADVAAHRIGLLTGPSPRTPVVPAQQGQADQWSAFVAPDLAPVFTDTPWLDIPPNEDGQADLLSRLDGIAADDFHAALARLTLDTNKAAHASGPPANVANAADTAAPPSDQPEPAPPSPASITSPASTPHITAHHTDPRRFLLDVMNNEQVPLALRIEAAKALLHHPDSPTGKA